MLELSHENICTVFDRHPRIFHNFLNIAKLQLEEACANNSSQVPLMQTESRNSVPPRLGLLCFRILHRQS